MRLRIDSCDDKNFILYLIKFIRNFLLYKIDYSKLIKMEEYLNTVPEYTNNSKTEIYCREIINLAARMLKYKAFSGHYEIYIDNNIFFHNSTAKLYDICKLINYGNLSIQGTMVFTETMNYISEHISEIYMRYIEGFSV